MVMVEEFAGGVYFSRDTADAMEAPAQMIPYPRSRFPKAICPNARLGAVRRRVAGEVAVLNPDSELEALYWIEGVSEFDDGDEVL
jgi:hypothetical protein